MPYRRKDTAYWWISYIGPSGKQIRRSAETAIYDEAKAIEQQLRAESYQSRKQGVRRSGCFAAVLAEYLDPRISPRTRSTARHLAAAFDGMAVEDITTAVLDRYCNARIESGASVGTLNKELSMLCAAINAHNRRHGSQLPNAARGMKHREPEGKLRWLTREEYRRLLDASSPAIRDFVRLACNTGLRKGEILALTWSQVDFGRAIMTIEAAQSKSRKRRSVPLNREALAALKSRAAACDGSVYVFCHGQHRITDIKKGFGAACRRAGLSDVTPHTCRHTFASWLVTAGVPLYEVRDLLGHSTIKLTERYSHLAPENLRIAVEKIA